MNDTEKLKQLEVEINQTFEAIGFDNIAAEVLVGCTFDENGNLIGLALDNLPLGQVPEIIFQFSNLLRLSLFGCELQSVSGEISRLKNLRALSLGLNKLTSLPSEIGQLSNLEELYLFGNQLNALPEETCQLVNLKCLLLKYNQIKSLPEQITHLNMEFNWGGEYDGIDLMENPLESPPVEVVKKGKEAVEEYFNSLNK